MSDIDLRQTVINLAFGTVKDLMARYQITDPNQAKRIARETFTQDDYNRYQQACAVLDGMGAIN